MDHASPFRDAVGKLMRKVMPRRGRDVSAVFEEFRLVLAANSESLDAIADMTDKLGGEYIFDAVYVLNASDAIISKVGRSVEAFRALTEGRYDLDGPFASISSAIGRIARETRYEGTPSYVLSYPDISWEHSQDVGGKNYHLARMSQAAGLHVPEAFAITVSAFDRFISHNHLENAMASCAGAEACAIDELRRAIADAEVPPEVAAEITSALARMRATCPEPCFLAVRSSAEEEDGEFSFAGQFDTALNVPAEPGPVMDAYKRVLASLYSERSVAYLRGLGYPLGSLRMAVACVRMVDARSSGVVYTAQAAGRQDQIVVNAVWGLGNRLVEGGAEADLYVFERGPLRLGESRIADKPISVSASSQGGVADVDTPAGIRNAPCLTDAEAMALAQASLDIERMFHGPQDIEWAMGQDGMLYMLQARPLKVEERANGGGARAATGEALLRDTGSVVQPGVAAGRVVILTNPKDLERVARGSILVAKADSPQFIVAMHRLAAIITDSGSPTGHMASLCRELRVPAVVNTRAATHLLRDGAEVTLHADTEGHYAIFEGIDEALLRSAGGSRAEVERLYEYRRKRSIMRFVTPLNLVNPLVDDFRPERCETLHDLLRFIHEKAVQELIAVSSQADRSNKPRDLSLPVPMRMKVIDIGGGIAPSSPAHTMEVGEIVSEPLRAIVAGMVREGVWKLGPAAMGVGDFMTSMMRTDDITQRGEDYLVNNVAVVSGEYMNLSLRLGYHFNLIDCYASGHAAHNHIYFRFFGGATDMTKRSRRVRMIETILNEIGFISDVKGDLIVARISGLEKPEVLRIIERLGCLVAFTKQLDTELVSDESAAAHAREFLEQYP